MNTHRSLIIALALFALINSVEANPFRHEPAPQAPTSSQDSALQNSAKPTPDPLPEGLAQKPYLINPAARVWIKLADKFAHSDSPVGAQAKSDSEPESRPSSAPSPEQASTAGRDQADSAAKQSASWLPTIFGRHKNNKPAQTPPAEVLQHLSKVPGDARSIDQNEFSNTTSATLKANRPAAPTEGQPQRVEQAFAATTSLDSVEATLLAELGPTPVVAPLPEREKIIYRPTVLDVNQFGQPVLRPNVQLASQNGANWSDDTGQILPGEMETIIPEQWAAPIVDQPYEQYAQQCVQCPPRLGPFQELCCRVRARLNGPCCKDPGIGTERVAQAISFIDTTQPQNNFRMRLDAAYDYMSPDRAEYFWARIDGRGPTTNPSQGGEISVDYQDIRAYIELGGKKFSVGTDLPIRMVDPVLYDNTAGLGDISITTKTVLVDCKQWQITNLLRTYIPSGDASAGLGTGHASLEPGFAFRYRWSDITYLHGDLKLWIPLGADEIHGGEVLSYGVGISHVWRENDSTAIMPTLEIVGYSFLDGRWTAPLGMGGGSIEIDGQDIVNIHPGIRWVWDRGCACHVRELGLFGGFSTSSSSLYEGMMRLEYRWMW
jgi:hypothetical protein